MENRFWSKVQKTDNCWLWLAYITQDGYGQFGLNGKVEYAHRIAYELIKGKIPKGLELDHLCRNPKCVNPNHLEAVTRRINQLRGFSVSGKNARKMFCMNFHPFNKENTYRSVKGRECRICRKLYMREYRKRNVK